MKSLLETLSDKAFNGARREHGLYGVLMDHEVQEEIRLHMRANRMSSERVEPEVKKGLEAYNVKVQTDWIVPESAIQCCFCGNSLDDSELHRGYCSDCD